MDPLTIVAATSGGALIGLAASLMLLLNGRIAGISGIVGGALKLPAGDLDWRLIFVLGLLTGGALLFAISPGLFATDLVRSPWAIIAAGLLVGVGVRLGNGCTSGHGVCGLARFSPRSLAATITFMGTGAIMAAVVTWAFGGVI
jgi:uncharacterized membrane protein YedE/YeeE